MTSHDIELETFLPMVLNNYNFIGQTRFIRVMAHWGLPQGTFKSPAFSSELGGSQLELVCFPLTTSRTIESRRITRIGHILC